jgi:serine protease Do
VSRGLRVLLAALALAAAVDAAAAPARWGWLGVRIRDLSEQEMEDISRRHGIREGFGAMIVEVMQDTPAAASGLRTGDLVVGFRGRPVVDTRTLQRLVSAAPLGEALALTVLRPDEGRRTLPVRLAAMPALVVAERVAVEFGFVLADPARGPVATEPRPEPTVPGVAAVLPGRPAARAGLRVGDVLVEIEGRPALTLGDARELLAGRSLEEPLRLVVRREDELLPLRLEPAAP